MVTRQLVIAQAVKHASAAAVALSVVMIISALLTAVFGLGVSLLEEPLASIGTKLNDTQ